MHNATLQTIYVHFSRVNVQQRVSKNKFNNIFVFIKALLLTILETEAARFAVRPNIFNALDGFEKSALSLKLIQRTHQVVFTNFLKG